LVDKEIRDNKGNLIGTISDSSSSSTGGTSIREDLLENFFGGVVCTVIFLGALWGLLHTTEFSALWWLCIAIGLPTLIYAIRFLIGLVVVLGLLYLIYVAIIYFMNNQ